MENHKLMVKINLALIFCISILCFFAEHKETAVAGEKQKEKIFVSFLPHDNQIAGCTSCAGKKQKIENSQKNKSHHLRNFKDIENTDKSKNNKLGTFQEWEKRRLKNYGK